MISTHSFTRALSMRKLKTIYESESIALTWASETRLNACSAIYALVWMNVKLVFILVDTINGACIYTGPIFHSYTRFSNDIRHDFASFTSLPIKMQLMCHDNFLNAR